MKQHFIYTRFFKKTIKKYTKNFIFESRNPSLIIKNKRYNIDKYNYTALHLIKNKKYQQYLKKKQEKQLKKKQTFSFPTNLESMLLTNDNKRQIRFFSVNLQPEKQNKMKLIVSKIRRLILQEMLLKQNSTESLKTKILYSPGYKKTKRFIFKFKSETHSAIYEKMHNIEKIINVKSLKKKRTKTFYLKNKKKRFFLLRNKQYKHFFKRNVIEFFEKYQMRLNLIKYPIFNSYLNNALAKKFQYHRPLISRFSYSYILNKKKFLNIMKLLVLKLQIRKRLKKRNMKYFSYKLKLRKLRLPFRQKASKLFFRYKLFFNKKQEKQHKFFNVLLHRLRNKKKDKDMKICFSNFCLHLIKNKKNKQIIFGQWKIKMYKYILKYILRTVTTRKVRTKNMLAKYKSNIFLRNKMNVNSRYSKLAIFKAHLKKIRTKYIKIKKVRIKKGNKNVTKRNKFNVRRV